jgi:tRNA(Ile)-lysidine synthase
MVSSFGTLERCNISKGASGVQDGALLFLPGDSKDCRRVRRGTIPALAGEDGRHRRLVASSGERGGRGKASLTRKARALMVREALFPPGSRVLVMVSGGQDSRALLDILAGLTGRPGGPAWLHALHVNHHLREGESDDDEALTIRACGHVGVSLSIVHRPVVKSGGNVQEAAREARRAAALQVAQEQGCDRVALAHTADDQAETVLYRLGRYGGMAAFRAMLPCDPPWVRPLLECRRVETAAYCLDRGLEFAQDRGNAYPGYVRTAIRERVLPAWEAALPGAVEAAGRAAQVAAETEKLIEVLVNEAESRVRLTGLAGAVAAAVLGPGGAVEAAGAAAAVDGVREANVVGPLAREDDVFSVSGLLSLEPALRRLLLHRWLERRARPAASRASVLALEALLTTPGSAERSLAGGWRGLKEYDALTLARRGRRPQVTAPPPATPLAVPGRARWGEVLISATPVDAYAIPEISVEAYVDARCLEGTLEVRGPRPGDRVHPLGMSGTRKLQDVLVDLRVPAAARQTVPLVVCDGRVVWVGGLLVAEEGRIAEETVQIVRLRLGQGHDGETPDEAGGQGAESEGDGPG